MEPYERFYIYEVLGKRIFLKKKYLDDKWLLKIAQKIRKCIFLFNGPNLERVLELRPPLLLFFNFSGGRHASSIQF